MFVISVKHLPTQLTSEPPVLISVSSPTESDTRARLAVALCNMGLSVAAAQFVADNTEIVWTDFAEHGLTAVLERKGVS